MRTQSRIPGPEAMSSRPAMSRNPKCSDWSLCRTSAGIVSRPIAQAGAHATRTARSGSPGRIGSGGGLSALSGPASPWPQRPVAAADHLPKQTCSTQLNPSFRHWAHPRTGHLVYCMVTPGLDRRSERLRYCSHLARRRSPICGQSRRHQRLVASVPQTYPIRNAHLTRRAQSSLAR